VAPGRAAAATPVSGMPEPDAATGRPAGAWFSCSIAPISLLFAGDRLLQTRRRHVLSRSRIPVVAG
jgi:hypothetical protein